MPIYHAPIFHDRQTVSSIVLQTTSSSTFSDVVGASITAKDLAQPGTYLGWLSLLMSNSNNNAIASFRLTINGNPIGTVAPITLKVKDLDIGYTLMSDLGGAGIVEGDVLQLQFATDTGTLSLSLFSILVDGIPQSRVIE